MNYIYDLQIINIYYITVFNINLSFILIKNGTINLTSLMKYLLIPFLLAFLLKLEDIFGESEDLQNVQ